MKILWFTNTPVDLYEDIVGYNGGGWMSSLKKKLDRDDKFELGIVFLGENSDFKISKQKTVYYPVSNNTTVLKKIISRLKNPRLESLYNYNDELYVNKYIEVINDFKPSVIHIWGTEKNFGLICNRVKIPVVIHLQGIITPYLNAFLPPGVSKMSYYLKDGINPFKIRKNNITYKSWRYTAKREQEIFLSCSNFIGRTNWDKSLTAIFSNNASYFHCDEMLRDEFYSLNKWECCERNKLKLLTTISSPLYKGGDLLLKTAFILKNKLHVDFEWIVYGVEDLDIQEKQTGICAKDVNVDLRGIASSNMIKDSLLDCNVYVYPSYIDNSPNSVCEAQLCGVPVISTCVGGLPSLIENNVSGFLLPANDPYLFACKIKDLCFSSSDSIKISEGSVAVATKRHAPEKILSQIRLIYSSLCS